MTWMFHPTAISFYYLFPQHGSLMQLIFESFPQSPEYNPTDLFLHWSDCKNLKSLISLQNGRCVYVFLCKHTEGFLSVPNVSDKLGSGEFKLHCVPVEQHVCMFGCQWGGKKGVCPFFLLFGLFQLLNVMTEFERRPQLESHVFHNDITAQ